MKKYNVMVVSNSIEYADQLRRTAMFNDILDIDVIVKSANELKNRLKSPVDVFIISDVLGNNDTLSDIIHLIEDMDSYVFAVIQDESNGILLDSIGINYFLENRETPSDVIEFISESLLAFDNEIEEEIDEDISFDEEEEEVKIENEKVEQPQPPKSQKVMPSLSKTTKEEKPKPMKKEIKEPLPTQYQEPERKVQSPRMQRGRTTMGIMKNKVVSFTSSKGGVGKSSISIEVASCIAHRANQVEFNLTNQRGLTEKINVCLVDLNFAFGTIPSTLDCVVNATRPVTLADWVVAIENKILQSLSVNERRELQSQTYPDFVSAMNTIKRSDLMFTKQEIMNLLIHDETTGLYVLPTVSSPFDVDGVKREYIPLIIEELSRIFDIIIIDTGNNLSHFTSEAYNISDEIYVIGQPVLNVGVILKQLIDAAVNTLHVDKDKFRLVINHPNMSNKGLDPQGMANSLGIPLVSEIPYDENLGIAHEAGLYYAINNRKRRFSNEVALLANQICPLWNIADKPKKSLAQKLFGK